MKAEYFPDGDMLYIALSDTPSMDGQEIKEGFVFYFDEDQRVVAIEVDEASKRVDLSKIKSDPSQIATDPDGEVLTYTPSMVAEQLGVTNRAITNTVRAMGAAGIEVGRPANELHDNSPILLTEGEVEEIKQWRKAHPRGRPKTEEATV